MPITFEDFECVFLENYSLLDDANIVHDKICKLKQCGAIQDYIMAFDNIVMSCHYQSCQRRTKSTSSCMT